MQHRYDNIFYNSFKYLFEPETLVANDGLGQLTYQKVYLD